jgi:glycosyltransferase involved in cell wall biosynthesis
MQTKMRRVLFIAYYFPPLGGSGVMRAVKLAKYLPQFGWNPTVLTVSQGDSFVYDDTLLMELPGSVIIERVRSIEIKTTQAKKTLDQIRTSEKGADSVNPLKKELTRWLKYIYFSIFIPDDKIGWLFTAVNKAIKLNKQHNFEAIFATSPPQTDLLIGTRLKRRLNIPVVLDYRDEWTTHPYPKASSRITFWLNRALEKRVLKNADALTVVSAGMLDKLSSRKLTTGQNNLRCKVLPNGFDPADFNSNGSSSPSDKFSIVYTGSFFSHYKVPDPFLRALHLWLGNSPQVRGNVEVLFYGSIYPRHQYLIDELQLNDIVRVMGLVPHYQAILAQQNASILLLIIGKEGKTILTGKVFEYMGAKRPVLAVAPTDGEAADIIRQTNIGIVIDPDDTTAIANAIEDFYTEWRNGHNSYSPRDEEVKQYSRQEQAHQLSELFAQLS